MQDRPAACHLSHAENTPDAPVQLVHGAAQELENTASRHTGPRAWLRAVEWLVAAGMHPKATGTTLTVARELARRMDYGTGHVRYSIPVTMAATGLSRGAVTGHVKVLRELGALVWVQHGTRANIRRVLGLAGYAGTATVYAAAIPTVYDRALGYRIVGEGYEARALPVRPHSPTGAAGRGCSGSSWTPSLTVVPIDVQAQVVGGSTATAPARTAERRANRKTRATILGLPITFRMVAAAHRAARRVRPLVPWVQRASLRQLSWVLLDVVARGWDEQRIAVWLRELTPYDRDGLVWRPLLPHRVLAAALLDEQRAAESRARRERDLDAAAPPNAAFLAALTANAPETDEPGPDDLAALRTAARRDPGLIAGAVALCGIEHATRIYGPAAVDRALTLAFASPNVRFH